MLLTLEDKISLESRGLPRGCQHAGNRLSDKAGRVINLAKKMQPPRLQASTW